MGAFLSTNESPSSSQPTLQQEPSNPPLEETAPTPQSGGEGVGEIQEHQVDGEGKDEDEEEGECGFCLFMKAGGCRETFIGWEKCVEEAEKNKEDIVEKCYGVTTALKACMEAHPDHYGPILKAEKAAEAEVVKELEKEENKSEESNSENAAGELEKEKKSEEPKAEKAAQAEAPGELEKEKEKKSEESESVVMIKMEKEGMLREKEAS